MRLKPISLSKLLQSELYSLYYELIQDVLIHDVHKLHIEESFHVLQSHHTQVQSVAKEYDFSPITKKLNGLHTRRLEYASFISTQVQSVVNFKKNDLSNEIIIAESVVRSHLLDLRKNNRSSINILLQEFFRIVDEDPEVNNAFQTISLHSYIEEWREINQNYHTLYIERRDLRAFRQRGAENKQIQKKGHDLIRSFFTQLQLAQDTYPELKQEYTPLFSTLNLVITKYTKLIKTRAALNKRKAAAKAKAAAEADSKIHVLCVNGKESGSILMEGEKKGKKLKDATKKGKLSKKKTVYSTSKKKNTNKNNKKTIADAPDKKKDKGTINGLLNILKLPLGDK